MKTLALFRLAVFVVGVTAQSACYYPDGSLATELLPCISGSENSACCPSTSATNLYPLDYPNCTPDGLCKAGNSDFLARGGCTDPTYMDSNCPGYCKTTNSSSMAGITDCGDGGPWYCCDADHDAGLCDCSPASGSAFKLSGDPTPIFFSDDPTSVASTTASPSSTTAMSAFPTTSSTTTPVMITSNTPSIPTTSTSTRVSSIISTSSIPLKTFTVFTTLQSTSPSGSSTSPTFGLLSGGTTTTVIGGSTTAPAQPTVSQAGALGFGTQRGMGEYLAALAAVLAVWLG